MFLASLLLFYFVKINKNNIFHLIIIETCICVSFLLLCFKTDGKSEKLEA